jgi:hypothetical protein
MISILPEKGDSQRLRLNRPARILHHYGCAGFAWSVRLNKRFIGTASYRGFDCLL